MQSTKHSAKRPWNWRTWPQTHPSMTLSQALLQLLRARTRPQLSQRFSPSLLLRLPLHLELCPLRNLQQKPQPPRWRQEDGMPEDSCCLPQTPTARNAASQRLLSQAWLVLLPLQLLLVLLLL